MKRRFFLLILAFLVSLSLSVAVAAAENDTPYELYTIDEFDTGSVIDSLPNEVKDELPDGDLFAPDGFSSRFDVGYFFSLIKNTVSDLIPESVRVLSLTLGIVLISSAFSAMRGLIGSDALSAVLEFVSGLCVMLSVFECISSLVERVSLYLTQLCTAVNAMVPVMIAVGTAGGNVTASAVAASGMMVGLSIVENLTASGLFPVLRLCLGLSAASCFGALKLSGVSKLIRDVYVWILGLISAVISAVMSFQSSIACRADSLSMRAVKFAASNTVPVIGGIAGDAVSAVAGSIELIRGTFGWVGVIIVLVMTLPVTVNIILTRLAISISCTAADTVGLSREKELLSEMCGLLGFLAAVCVISALMFIYGLAVFSKMSAALS